MSELSATPSEASATSADDPNDDPDDQFQDLLAGLRTTLPGSQVLLGFLLTVSFQSGASEALRGTARVAYLVSLLATSAAAVLLIAPSAQARARDPVSGLRRRSHRHVRHAAYLALVGTAFLLVGIVAAAFLTVELVLSTTWAVVVAVVIGLTAAWTWFGVPVWWTVRGE